MTADDALHALREGNRRFVENRLAQPRRTPERRAELAASQHPFAAVLTCSDSRVVPEILFDQGLGDLFVVRIAGNVADEAIRESLEYAAEHLRLPLIVVLGHTRCGAITVAISHDSDPAADVGRLRQTGTAGASGRGGAQTLLRLLRPAVVAARKEKGDRVAHTAFANVRLVVEALRQTTPILAEPQRRDELRIVGAIYDITTGVVEWLRD
jgi:carbonic anhydrase